MNKKFIKALVLPVLLAGLVSCGGGSTSVEGPTTGGAGSQPTTSAPTTEAPKGEVTKYSFVGEDGNCNLRELMPVIYDKVKGSGLKDGSAVGPGDLTVNGFTFVLNNKTYADNKSYDETKFPGLKFGDSKGNGGEISSKVAGAYKKVTVEALAYNDKGGNLIVQTSTDGTTYTEVKKEALAVTAASFDFELTGDSIYFKVTGDARLYIKSISITK